MMREKKLYQAPQISRFGSVDEITQAFGTPTLTDTIFNADGTIRGQGAGNSADGIFVPPDSLGRCDTPPDACEGFAP